MRESVCVCEFSSSFSVGLFLFSPCLLARATREDLALLRFVLALSRGLSLSFSLVFSLVCAVPCSTSCFLFPALCFFWSRISASE